VNLEIPHVSILTKMDLMSKRDKKRLHSYLEPEAESILMNEVETKWNAKFLKLTTAIGQVLDNYSLVRFYTLDNRRPRDMESLLLMIDIIMGVSDDADIKTRDFEEEEEAEGT